MRPFKHLILKKIKKTSSCWLWTGGTNGRYGVYGLWKQKLRYVHRIMWSMHNKKRIPDGLEICHKCDNTLCVNPKHLFVATHKDNFLDAKIKNRMASGNKHGVYTNPNAWTRDLNGRWASPILQP